jgi:hypothetical protein
MPNPHLVVSGVPDTDITDWRPSYADVTELLLTEFSDLLGVKLVSDVIMAGRARRDGQPELITPNTLEQLCRRQLDSLASA